MSEARPRGANVGRAAATVSVLFLVAAALAIGDVGSCGDEVLHVEQGERLLRYYRTSGADRSALSFRNLRLYGGLFDLLSTLSVGALPGLPAHHVRHALTALSGSVGVYFAARIAALFGGAPAAWLAGLLLLTTPR